MLDAGMVILSTLGIGLARAGQPSRSARFLIMICAAASAGMNLAAADPARWRSVAAYVAAPVFLAVITDRVIAVIRQYVLPQDAESAWALLGRTAVSVLRLAAVVALYLLRTCCEPYSHRPARCGACARWCSMRPPSPRGPRPGRRAVNRLLARLTSMESLRPSPSDRPTTRAPLST